MVKAGPVEVGREWDGQGGVRGEALVTYPSRVLWPHPGPLGPQKHSEGALAPPTEPSGPDLEYAGPCPPEAPASPDTPAAILLQGSQRFYGGLLPQKPTEEVETPGLLGGPLLLPL